MPAVITAHQISQGTDEWLEARVGKYTGSNAHKLLSSFGAHEYAKALESSFGGNFYTKRGHLLEDEALAVYEALSHTSVERIGFYTNSLYPTCLYSPDGIDGDTLLEVKCFKEERHLSIFRSTDQYGIPISIRAQIHFGMLITGKRKAKLIIYNPRFAKRTITDELGVDHPNPRYDPRLAYRAIDIPHDRAIANNFKRIFTGG